jgi:GTP-binding protein
VDTPGHADFGGEVERILRMVDGVLILVDAFDGPMPQTRFVTRKALALGLQPIVVINKIDRDGADPKRVHDEVLELFMELEADEAQLDAPFLYAAAREGYAIRELGDERKNLTPLFEAILETVPAPPSDAGCRSRCSSRPSTTRRTWVGWPSAASSAARCGGRSDPAARAPQRRRHRLRAGRGRPPGRVSKLFVFEGLQRTEVESASAGEIVALAGLEGVEIGATITDTERPERLAGIAVEEPTISVDFIVNMSPFSGREGKYVTSRQLRDRLYKELERNVALRVEDTDSPDTFTVSGRGELHLGILMETMRREGYEFAVSRPRIITKKGPDGELLEPYEEVVIDVPEAYVGVVIEKLGGRRGEMLEMRSSGQGEGSGLTRIVYRCPHAACSATAASSSPTRAARACCTTASAGTAPGPARSAAATAASWCAWPTASASPTRSGTCRSAAASSSGPACPCTRA